MMAASGRVGRKENCLRACGGKRWDGCVVGGAVGVGTGGKEMSTAGKALLLMDRIRGIFLHLGIAAPMQGKRGKRSTS